MHEQKRSDHAQVSNHARPPAKSLSPNASTMIQLCQIAYLEAKDITAAVTDYDDDLSVVWGPAWKSTLFGNPYSLAFVVQSSSSGALTLVNRGTNPTSLEAWLSEDLHIDRAVPFSNYVSSAPASAVLSAGTAAALEDVMAQRPEDGYASKGVALLDYLQGFDELGSLTITGHSLGGTLTPALYAWLYNQLVTSGSQPTVEMGLMSFAGLTPGNAAFAEYLETLVPASPSWRVVNPFDIAPLLFESLDAVQTIYSADQLAPDIPENALLEHLFNVAAVAYAQPSDSEMKLPGAFDTAQNSWAAQAMYQHHVSTYVELICG